MLSCILSCAAVPLLCSAEAYDNVPATRVDLQLRTQGQNTSWLVTQGKQGLLPYVYWHYYFGSMVRVPPSLRRYEDDIASRPCLVGFINSHCTEVRKQLWARIVAKVNNSQLVFAGHCAGDGRRTGTCVPRASARDAIATHCPASCGACAVDGVCSLRVRAGGTVVEAFSKCRIALALENNNHQFGYITEKIMNVYLAGAIPVYGGDVRSYHHRQIFNPASMLDVDTFYNSSFRGRPFGDGFHFHDEVTRC
jgi:hypothetical protein